MRKAAGYVRAGSEVERWESGNVKGSEGKSDGDGEVAEHARRDGEGYNTTIEKDWAASQQCYG